MVKCHLAMVEMAVRFRSAALETGLSPWKQVSSRLSPHAQVDQIGRSHSVQVADSVGSNPSLGT